MRYDPDPIRVKVLKKAKTSGRRRKPGFRLRAFRASNPNKILWERASRGRTRREALKEATAIEAGIAESDICAMLGQGVRLPGTNSWQEVASAYKDEVVGHNHPSTWSAFKACEKALELTNLRLIDHFNSGHVFRIKQLWERQGYSPATISTYMRSLRAFMKWAHANGYKVHAPPPIKAAATEARCRGVTPEQYHLMRVAAKEYQWVIDVLWLSNLRIGEIPHVTWDYPGELWMDLANLRWHVGEMKGKISKYKTFPIPPDFAEWVQNHWSRQEGERYVFPRMDYQKLVAKIGRRAGCIVGVKSNGRAKFASSHDFRRALAERWAPVLMPAELQVLMRHANFATTLRYYLHLDGDAVASKMQRHLQHLGASNTPQHAG